mmetsp:Transcript_38633/g.76030  ORF Transcript_38633/g.76030 Transcript_38633/m.76030 type:complete len:96 (-) Transcript_38633:1365-1652(-)
MTGMLRKHVNSIPTCVHVNVGTVLIITPVILELHARRFEDRPALFPCFDIRVKVLGTVGHCGNGGAAACEPCAQGKAALDDQFSGWYLRSSLSTG